MVLPERRQRHALPVADCCSARRRGEWCTADNLEKLSESIASNECFDPTNSDAVRAFGEGLFLSVEKLAEEHVMEGQGQSPAGANRPPLIRR